MVERATCVRDTSRYPSNMNTLMFSMKQHLRGKKKSVTAKVNLPLSFSEGM